MLRILGIAAFTLLFSSLAARAQSAPAGTSIYLEPVNGSDLPTMPIDTNTSGSDSKTALQSAVQKQLAQCLTQAPNDTWDFGGKKIVRGQWCVKTAQWFLNKLSTAATLEEVYQAAKKELTWYRSKNTDPTGNNGMTPGPNDVLFTGYYQPSLKAKLVSDSVYHFPIYRMPFNPNFSRAQIVAGALNGQNLEIAYASNPVDPYLLEVQGSGALLLQNSDGTQTQILANYAGTNGFPYTSLGKLMRTAGIDEQYISLQGIRQYFITDHPEQWLQFSNQNQSYVFFSPAKDGPFGSSGVVLTPGHSIAVDHSIFPMGAFALVQSEKPTNQSGTTVDAWQPFTQFMISEDTGGAIQGSAHVDIYWGNGDYAELVAGHSQQIGRLFFCLVP